MDGADPPPPVVLVDTSYVVFSKYYSTSLWARFARREQEASEPLEPAFLTHFSNSFESALRRLVARVGASMSDVVFAKDCARRSVWRRSVLPSYKAGRSKASKFNPAIFCHTYNSLLPSLCARLGCRLVGAPNSEADDIIAVAHRVARSCASRRVVIISNDNDYIQLCDEHTRIINLSGNGVERRRGRLTPERYLWLHIIAGDRSDNIPGAMRIGVREARDLVHRCTPDEIQASAPEGVRETLSRNRLLMDLGSLPPAIVGRIEAACSCALAWWPAHEAALAALLPPLAPGSGQGQWLEYDAEDVHQGPVEDAVLAAGEACLDDG